MAYKKSATSFYAEVQKSVNRAFAKQWRKRDQEKNQATTAALRLWVKLPKEIQGMLISWPDIETQLIADRLTYDLRGAVKRALLHDQRYGRDEEEDLAMPG
jgi:hypothetical protein